MIGHEGRRANWELGSELEILGAEWDEKEVLSVIGEIWVSLPPEKLPQYARETIVVSFLPPNLFISNYSTAEMLLHFSES